MKRLCAFLIIAVCMVHTWAQSNSLFRHLKANYVSKEELFTLKFATPLSDSLIALNFGTDSWPYAVGEDSLYKFDLGEERFVMYCNCSLLRNTGLLFYGNDVTKEVQVLQTNTIFDADVYILNTFLLIRTVEVRNDFAFGSPSVTQIKYWLVSFGSDSVKSLALLSCASALIDDSAIFITDNISKDAITFSGTINNTPISDTIVIARDFILPQYLEQKMWNDMPVFEKKVFKTRKFIGCR